MQLSNPDVEYQLVLFEHVQNAKFGDFGFISDTAVFIFSFCPLSSPLLLLFFCWAFKKLHFGGKCFLGKLLGS